MRIPTEGILAALADSDREALIGHGEHVSFRKGDELIREGQANGSLFVVLDGLLHVMRTTPDREVLLGRLEEGSCFGEVSLFDPGPASATIRAASDGVAVELRREQLRNFSEQRPQAAIALMVAIAPRWPSNCARSTNDSSTRSSGARC